MKILTLALSLFLLNLAQAEEPPMPSNPFSNLPPSSDAFSPFEDDFDEGFVEEAPSIPPPPTAGSRPNFPPRANPGSSPTNLDSGQARPPSLPRSPSPGQPRLEPANAKDMVENFDYPDAEILDVTKAIAKLTGKNFIYNTQDIKGRISVVSQTPITVGDAWNAFLTALNMKNFALVPSGKYLRIERIQNAKEKQTPIYTDKKTPNNDEFITRVIPLRYIDATEFEQAFRLWMPREARIQAYGQTNTIIITDTAAHINRMVELINLLDVAGYQESLVVLPIRNATAKDIARLIEQILNEGRGSSSQGSFGMPPRPQPAYGGTSGRTGTGRGKSGGSTISKIIADDRTNALIVKANAAGILEIRALVRRLDQKVATSEGSGRIHVIQLQYADAETMAKTLSSITAGSGQRQQTRTFPVFGEQAAAFQNDIKVAADKTTQSLVITASPQDFATFKKVVETLDVPRDQVFIEALLMEMRITKGENIGSSFINAPNGIYLPSASNALQDILAGNPLAAGGFALGFKQGISREVGVGTNTFKVNSVNGLFELLQKNSNANVIATPKIIALDNEEAVFEISDKIKVPVTTTPTAGGQSTRSFTDDEAVTLLKVTPQINKASNFVKLNIEQKLQNFDSSNVPKELQGETRGKNSRSTTTKVIVQNEDTVVLSGLIRDQITETVQKVPFLGDIPILGWLFKNSSRTITKTNLLVFITPRIVKQYDMMRKILKRNMDERDDFVRENIGSKDPFAKKIGETKKELPDLTVIEPLPKKRPQESASFNLPSPPEREYEEEFYDPNAYYYPPEGPIPLPPVNNQSPGIDVPADNLPPPPAVPQEPDFQ